MYFMKTHKKHNFSHKDPEKTNNDILNPTQTKQESKNDEGKNSEFMLIRRDLKKTIIMVAIFFVITALLYIIQIKTDWLSPALKIFGL